jgi:Na+-translocating ferredoxin:NAD+ oxidoreductase RnfE subunit
MTVDRVLNIAGYASLGVFIALFVVNVVIVVARLTHNRKLADLVASHVGPVAALFRLGNLPKDTISQNHT